jgi:FkbM family methyltransferase
MALKGQVLELSNKRRLKKLHQILLTLPEFKSIHLVDIGAAGDIEPRWRSISRFIKYLGFEPDSRSREELINRNKECQDYKIAPIAVWDSNGTLTLQLCAKPEVSSYFPPNLEILKYFPDKERFHYREDLVIECATLDSLEIENPDFIKIDIQGGELRALHGSTKTLEECFGVELEVEFLELYKGQPLFGEIVNYLELYNFQFLDFVNLCRWERDSQKGIGQLVFGDGLFLKTPESFIVSNNSISKISSYLATLLIYERYDLITAAISLLNYESQEEFKAFSSKVAKLRKAFNRFNKVVWVLNLFVKSGNQNRRLHLIH